MSHGAHMYEVEFLGGPNDGCIELTAKPPAELVVMVQLPSRRRGIFWLARFLNWFSPTVVRLYSYKLVARGNVWYYEHSGTAVAQLTGLGELDALIPEGARKQQLA